MEKQSFGGQVYGEEIRKTRIMACVLQWHHYSGKKVFK